MGVGEALKAGMMSFVETDRDATARRGIADCSDRLGRACHDAHLIGGIEQDRAQTLAPGVAKRRVVRTKLLTSESDK
jgi:hypothetical protein